MKFLIAAGAAFGLASMMFAASTFSGTSPNVQAGEETPECVTYTPTRTATRTATPGTPATSTNTPCRRRTRPQPIGAIYDGGISGGSSEGGVSNLGNETPRAECPTPTRTGTATPVTPTATGTVVPPTAIPATSTPTGGSGGAVTPPNTGTGDGLNGSGMSMWSMVLLAAIAAVGGGAVLAGARKRS